MSQLTHRQQAVLDMLAAHPGDASLERIAELLQADTLEVKYALFDLCDLGLVRRAGVYRYVLASAAAPQIEPQASGDLVTPEKLIAYLNTP